MTRHLVVAFDVFGTLFGLDRLRVRLDDLGAPPHSLDLWFASSLRDAFAWSHAGGYRPLREFLEADLVRTLVSLGIASDRDAIERVMASLEELDPAPDAREAVEMLSGSGRRVVALTNGSEASTRGLLERAGLLDAFAETLSCDRVRKTKPHPEVYALASEGSGGETWLVAGHAWDVAGASRAGLRTAWIDATGAAFPAVYPEPDVVAGDLAEAARRILGWSPGRSSDPPTG